MIKKVLSILFFYSFLWYGFCWSDDDAAGSWNDAQKEEDRFYSGENYHDEDDNLGSGYQHESDYEKAVNSLEAAQTAARIVRENLDQYTEQERQAVEHYLEQAQEKFSEACKARGGTAEFSTDGMYAKEVSPQGRIVSRVGDPVVFSQGFYIHESEDFERSYGSVNFCVSRVFRTVGDNKNERSGVFGKGWCSNLDSRIIRGTEFYDPELTAAPADEDESDEDEDFEEDDELNEAVSAFSFEVFKTSLEKQFEIIEKVKKRLTDYSDDLLMETVIPENFDVNQEPEIFAEYEDDEDFDWQEFENQQCLVYLKYVNEVKELYEQKLAELDLKRQKSARNAELNKYVRGGWYTDQESVLPLDCCVFVDESGLVFLLKKEGNQWKNLSESNESFDFQMFDDDSVSVTYSYGKELKYNPYGQLVCITDKHGNSTEIFWNNNQPVKAAINKKIIVEFTGENGFIKAISCGENRVNYIYENGLLKSFTDIDKRTVSYRYDERNNICLIRKNDDSVVSVFYTKYNDGIYRVTSIKNENGDTENIEYDLSSRTAVYSDPDGVKSWFSWDINGRTVSERYSDGRTIQYLWQDGILRSRIDNGKKTTYEFDLQKRLIKELHSDGSYMEVLWSEKNLVYIKFLSEEVITFNYDHKNYCTEIYLNGSLLKGLRYDASGFLTGIRDCRNYFTELKYDSAGNLIQKGNLKWQFDGKNRIKAVYKDNKIFYTVDYSADGAQVKYAGGLSLRQKFSRRGDVIQQLEEDSVTGKKRLWNFSYDNCHRLLKITLNGAVTNEFFYTKAGRISEYIIYGLEQDLINGAGLWGRNIWNSSGQLCETSCEIKNAADEVIASQVIQLFSEINDTGIYKKLLYEDQTSVSVLEKQNLPVVVAVNGKICNAGPFFEYIYRGGKLAEKVLAESKALVQKYDYYADGKIKAVEFSSGYRISYFYDECERLVKSVSPAGSWEWKYDGNGNLESYLVKNNSGNVLIKKQWMWNISENTFTCIEGDYFRNEYKTDGWGNIIKAKDGNGNVSLFEYDEYNRLKNAEKPNGEKITYSYDCLGNLTGIVSRSNKIQYFYDANGNCIKCCDNAGDIFRSKYDGLGNLVEYSERPFSSVKRFTYDNNCRLIEIKVNEKVQAQNQFSEDGRSITRIDSKGLKNILELDEGFNLRKWTDRNGVSSLYEYDNNGQLQRAVDNNGIEKKITYSDDGLEAEVRYSNNNWIKKIWNAAGALIKAENQDSCLEFKYDTSGKLIESKDVMTGTYVKYAYDNGGNVIKAYSPERTILYEWNNNHQLKRISDASENIFIDFEYTEDGKEKKRIFSTGEFQKSFYDDSGRMILRAGYDNSGKLIFVSGKVYDENGFITFTLNSDFTVTGYLYDSNGRIKTVLYAYTDYWNEYLKNFVAECGMNTVSSALPLRLVSVSDGDYDSLSRICSLVSREGRQVHLTTQMLEITYEYDTEGNITKIETPYGTVLYRYDAENRLTNWGRNNYCLWDKNGNLLKKHTEYKDEEYKYSELNRIVEAVVTDRRSGEINNEKMVYDSLGRLYKYCENDLWNVTVLYNGFSFEEFYQYSGMEHYLEESENLPSDRFGGIDGYIVSRERTGTKQSEAEKTKINAGIKPQFCGKNILYDMAGYPAYFADSSRFIIFTDISGTVCKTIDENGNLESFDYDCYGSLVSGESPVFGYAGKRYDKITLLENFGYRYYCSNLGRFISRDPIKDGINWYAFCESNPLSYIDKDGLKIQWHDFTDMHDSAWASEHINGTDSTVGDEGCALTGYARGLSDFENRDLTPKDLCKRDIFSDVSGKRDEIDYGKLAGDQYTVEKTSLKGTLKTELTDYMIEKTITNATDANARYHVMVETNYKNQPSATHWVEATGKIVEVNGKKYVEITGTSINDYNVNSQRYIEMGWAIVNNVPCVPVRCIESVVTVKEKKDN